MRQQERRDRTVAWARAGLTRHEIVDRLAEEGFRASYATVCLDLRECGVEAAHAPRGRNGGGFFDKAARKRERGIARAAAKVRDRRRFSTSYPASGEYTRVVAADTAGTIFPSRVLEPGAERVLKDGANNAKIGGDVLVGRLRGAKIFTLTLEERATCPRSCRHWRGCYGNGMQWARRFRHGPELIDQLDLELHELCSRHELVLIRLHILGDFWSMTYARQWANWLERYSNLHVFGFTAWPPESEIGAVLGLVRDRYSTRFMIRNSDRTGRWGSFTITDPQPEKTIGEAIVCPEQMDANGPRKGVHCGSCAACWSTDRPIVFIRH